MRIRHIITVSAALALLVTAGCKTTEENYRAAYEKALAKQNEGLTGEELSGFAREEAMPKSVWRGDSIPLRAVYANTVAESDTTKAAERFNIILASFSQKFNAASAIARIRQAGWREAHLLIDKDKRYYVSAISTASLDSAVYYLNEIKSQPPIAIRPPYPYILDKVRNEAKPRTID